MAAVAAMGWAAEEAVAWAMAEGAPAVEEEPAGPVTEAEGSAAAEDEGEEAEAWVDTTSVQAAVAVGVAPGAVGWAEAKRCTHRM